MAFHNLFYSTVLLCVSLRQKDERGKTLFAILFHLLVKKTGKINDAQIDLSQNLAITLGCSMAHTLQARTQELILVYKDNLTRNHGNQRLLG